MSEEENLDSVTAENGYSALQKALEARDVKVDAQILKDALEEAHKAVVMDCEQCANGWHW
ncbi:MAG: hypothetical protein PHV51_01635 [Methanosarcinaceae archaeon]|nr:hypothetical protein [Methanosarcinaceae archaeon]MDD4496846.1 hypothetical protein [Methanosarcinaceae archaeon]